MQRHALKGFIAAVLTIVLVSCTTEQEPPPQTQRPVQLEEVATSDFIWTGVAVSQQGRIFVNYPRWFSMEGVSVWELHPDSTVTPYPDSAWNSWTPEKSATGHFVCVQSVYVDDKDRLWVLDPASPAFRGVVAGGAKLLAFDLKTNEVIKTIRFKDEIAPRDSYLNDVRVDTDHEVAYITDSGAGALIVVDLNSGRARRLLDNHPSTHAEDITLTFAGTPWLQPSGNPPQVHADGLALHPSGEYVYYQALTGRHLYRIRTDRLRDRKLSADSLAAAVETVGETGAADGIMFGSDGALYLSALEDFAIKRVLPDHTVELVVQDSLLAWPDSFAEDDKGRIYVTTSQIHLSPNVTEPYRLLRFMPPPVRKTEK